MNKELKEKVNQTIESIDGLERADPGPYFYTRLSARMEEVPIMNLWYWKLAVITILVLNLGSIFLVSNTSNDTDELNNLSEEYFFYIPDYEYLSVDHNL